MNEMFNRIAVLAFIAVATLSAAGCCCGPVGYSCGPTIGCDTTPNLLPTRLVSRAANRLVNPCVDGCGEVYYGERINHPPVLDPCGCEQSFRPILSRLRDCWGIPYHGACECVTSGCDTCDGSCTSGPVSFAEEVGHGTAPCASCMAGSQSQIPTAMHSASTVSRRSGSPTPASRPTKIQSSPVYEEVAPGNENLQPVVPQPDSHALQQPARRVRPASSTRSITR